MARPPKASNDLQRPRCNEPIQSYGAKLRFGNESYVPEMSASRKRAGVAVPVTYFHAAHTRMRWEPSSPDRPSRARRPVSSAPWPGIGAFWSGVGALRRSARRSEDRRRARAGDDRGSAARPRSASGWHRVASGRMLGCPGTGARLGRATTGPCEGSGHPGSGALVGEWASVPTRPIVVGVSWPRRPRAPGVRRFLSTPQTF